MHHAAAARMGFAVLATATLAAPAVAAPLRIMPIGDSLTWGFQSDGTATAGGWRAPLFVNLLEDGSSSAKWQSAGITGVDYLGSQSRSRTGSSDPTLPGSYTYDGPATVTLYGGSDPRADVIVNFDRDHEGHSGWRISERYATQSRNRDVEFTQYGQHRIVGNPDGDRGFRERLPDIFNPNQTVKYDVNGSLVSSTYTDATGTHGYGTDAEDVDVAMLMLGINDVRRGNGMSGFSAGSSSADYAPNIFLGLVNDLLSRMRDDAFLVVSTLLPVEASYSGSSGTVNATTANNWVRQFNADIKALLNALNNDQIIIVDAYNAFANGSGNGISSYYLSDDLHLSPTGNQVLADLYAPILLAIPEPTTVLLAAAGFGGLLMRRRAVN